MKAGLATGLIGLTFGISACSGNGSGTTAGVNVNARPTSNISPDGNGVAGAPPIVASNSVAQANANATDPPNKKRRLPVSGQAGPEVPLEYKPGPENSETATTMNAEGQPVEVRIFKGHSQLARVEAVWLGADEKLLRITLRDGSTVQIRTDRIANLSSAPSDLLLELAGGSK